MSMADKGEVRISPCVVPSPFERVLRKLREISLRV